MLCMFVCDREKKTETEKESNRETKISERERESNRKRERSIFTVCEPIVWCVHMCWYVCMHVLLLFLIQGLSLKERPIDWGELTGQWALGPLVTHLCLMWNAAYTTVLTFSYDLGMQIHVFILAQILRLTDLYPSPRINF